MSPPPPLPLNKDRSDAKHYLKAALAAHGGNPKDATVATALDRLIALNPTPAPCRHLPLLEGDWLLLSAPSFPDGERQADGTYVYTLGRLAFNMFQPQALKVVIQQVSQPVVPIQGTSQHSHDIVVKFHTLGDGVPPLEGIVRNLGVCEPDSHTALRVQFTGGVLEPSKATDLKSWNQVFRTSSFPSRSGLKDWWQNLFLKVMFGLVPPEGMNPTTGRSTFKMKRSPKGALEILYLDEELRITRGEKGTVLVCQRL